MNVNPAYLTCTATGFTCTYFTPLITYDWSDVRTIFAHKEDRFTVDEICLDIFLKTSWLKINEGMPGWKEFLERLYKEFPSIDKDWERTIMLPPFAANFTLIYDRENRTLGQAKAACYQNYP